MSAVLRISRLGAPVTVLGPGTRVALWVQGCTIGCKGCASTDTWDPRGGNGWELDDLAADMLGAAAEVHATGLTISGGEPFQQADALAELVALLREQWPGTSAVDVLLFTGYAAAAARRRSPTLWNSADIVVAGPYRFDRPSTHTLLGSSNQTIEVLSPLGATRLKQLDVSRRSLQMTTDDSKLALIGMPDPGDLDRIREALAARGIALGDVSWSSEGPR